MRSSKSCTELVQPFLVLPVEYLLEFYGILAFLRKETASLQYVAVVRYTPCLPMFLRFLHGRVKWAWVKPPRPLVNTKMSGKTGSIPKCQFFQNVSGPVVATKWGMSSQNCAFKLWWRDWISFMLEDGKPITDPSISKKGKQMSTAHTNRPELLK